MGQSERHEQDWPPKVWLLMGHKAGDNSQVMALAEGLGWPYEIKRFVYRRYELATNLVLSATLRGTVATRSSPLGAPWPDLVISAGRRNEPISRWIRSQADKRVRLVHLGRPWAPLERFDLIVTTPQYRLPEHPVVLHNLAPLQRASESRLAEARASWLSRLAHLPRPYIAVLIGGHSGPYVFDKATASRLGRQANAIAEEAGGSLLITTSARTPPQTIESLAAIISCPAEIFRWRPNAVDNPYFGYLAAADSLIVTGDSMSMLAEACATRKPVFIFDVGEGKNAMRPSSSQGSGSEPSDRAWSERLSGPHLRAFFYRQLMRIWPRRLTRDVRILQRQLIGSGRAVWLGEEFPAGPRPTPLEDTPRTVARVRALFKESPVRLPA